MYAPIDDINCHGIITIPITAVIRPPVTYEIRFGSRLEKSFEGETTLAAILVVSCAIKMTIIAKSMTTALSNLRISCTGSAIASP